MAISTGAFVFTRVGITFICPRFTVISSVARCTGAVVLPWGAAICACATIDARLNFTDDLKHWCNKIWLEIVLCADSIALDSYAYHHRRYSGTKEDFTQRKMPFSFGDMVQWFSLRCSKWSLNTNPKQLLPRGDQSSKSDLLFVHNRPQRHWFSFSGKPLLLCDMNWDTCYLHTFAIESFVLWCCNSPCTAWFLDHQNAHLGCTSHIFIAPACIIRGTSGRNKRSKESKHLSACDEHKFLILRQSWTTGMFLQPETPRISPRVRSSVRQRDVWSRQSWDGGTWSGTCLPQQSQLVHSISPCVLPPPPKMLDLNNFSGYERGNDPASCESHAPILNLVSIGNKFGWQQKLQTANMLFSIFTSLALWSHSLEIEHRRNNPSAHDFCKDSSNEPLHSARKFWETHWQILNYAHLWHFTEHMRR